ncbi:metallophosphoesterase [Rhizobium tubonense]|uniref:Calcineurin-like phosphoesterase domain-containing protein n=1 Tax=Rhizobium tubonense TaxID=484088 RepID=A0A2W4CJ85_9HYPH|nr:metallophosphoesterase [Rhizobium tubonense]PZM12989.1 hypothetical protein CPY51_15810 [Rhizobium tubonense]
MVKIIHITDTHILPKSEKLMGLDPAARLESVIASVNKDHADADFAVFSGDLTDKGDIESYRLFADLLDGLRVPYTLTLGNHDNRSAFVDVFGREWLDHSGHIQNSTSIGDVCILVLDTLNDVRADRGRLCRDRLSWLRSRLGEQSLKQKIIFMHHPPKSVNVKWFDQMLLEHPEAFWDCLRSAGGAEHIAFGHTHLASTGRWGDTSFSSNRGTCHHILLNTATNYCEFYEGPPSYDVLIVDEGGIVVHNSSPVDRSAILAREYPTEDGKGKLVNAGDI